MAVAPLGSISDRMRRTVNYANFTVVNVKRQNELANKHDPKCSWKKSHSKAKQKNLVRWDQEGISELSEHQQEQLSVHCRRASVKCLCGMSRLLNHVPCFACLISYALKNLGPCRHKGLQLELNGTMPTVTWWHCKVESLFAGLTEILSQQCFKCLAPAVYALSVR